MSTLSTEDQLEIMQLYARYAHSIDGSDHRGWRLCFTDSGWHGDSLRGRKIVGDDLEAFSREVHAEWADAGITTRHVTSNVLLEPVDADHVKAHSYGMFISTNRDDVPAVGAVGIYYDRIDRTPQGWRFAMRDAYIRNQSPEPE